MIKVIMHGCNGAMGKVVCRQADLDEELQIVAGIDVSLSPATFPIFSNIKECDMPADVIIDFSIAKAVPELLDYAAQKNLPLVVCTTGLDEYSLEKLDEVSKRIPVFLSANMSIGVNLLISLAQKAAGVLSDSGFDIEIVEKHHNRKIDAPSGTALSIGREINKVLDNKYDFVYDRSKDRVKRNKHEIGIHAIRGGTIVGEHTVIYAGKDEVIEITHKATSKEVFAVGAVEAAKFLIGKLPGKYDMMDLTNSK